MTGVYTAALLPTKPSLNDDSEFRHGFGAEASLPLTQSAPAVTHDTTRLCWIDVTQWDCYIHADAVRTLSWIFFYVIPLVSWRKSKISQEYGGWVANETSASALDRKYIGYLAISHILFSQILIFFSNLRCCAKSKFSSKATVNSITKTFFFNLTDQMTISGRWVVNAISVGNTKWFSKSVVTCQSVQPSMMTCAYFFFNSLYICGGISIAYG